MDLSLGSLVASLLIGSIGFVLFVYGKRQQRVPHLAVGLILLIYPYFVPSPILMIAIGAVLLGLLWYFVRRLGW